jgi:CheY-like chemotaxis protein
MKVLLAEDDVAQSQLFKSILEELGCKVVTMTTGIDAYEQVRNERFDAIVTDMQMPIMSGLEFLQALNRLRRNQPPSLIHSNEEELATNLKIGEVNKFFPFARGCLKQRFDREATKTYLAAFVQSVKKK